MTAKLQHLFFPHHSNNQRAKALHLSSLFLLTVFIGLFQFGLTLITRIHPGILGFATNINPERLIELTNSHRAERGLGALSLNPVLVEAARQKAADMFARNYWAHNAPDGKSPWWFFKNAGYNYLYAGENLAKDFADSEGVAQAWMNSPTHKDNILNGRYREIGVAVVDGILNGEETTLVVQLFGTQGGVTSIGGPAAQVRGVEELLSQEPEETEQMVVKSEEKTSQPVVSSFILTKGISLGIVALLMIILALDTIIISQRKTVRIAGKSFIHFSFFAIILLSILLSNQGKIL